MRLGSFLQQDLQPQGILEPHLAEESVRRERPSRRFEDLSQTKIEPTIDRFQGDKKRDPNAFVSANGSQFSTAYQPQRLGRVRRGGQCA